MYVSDRAFAPILVSVATLFIFAAAPASAQQQGALTAQQNAAANTQPVNNGEDFTRPENLLQLRHQYLTAPGSGGANGATRISRRG
jgi:hypothetical protein